MVPAIRNVGERCNGKEHCPVSFLSLINKVFENFVNNRPVDHIEKCGLLSDFWYDFRSS